MPSKSIYSTVVSPALCDRVTVDPVGTWNNVTPGRSGGGGDGCGGLDGSLGLLGSGLGLGGGREEIGRASCRERV